MGHLNVEIKAKCSNSDSNQIRDILNSRNAKFKGLDYQIDTYFKTPSGRLKLREGKIENYLIYYDRINKTGPKQSNVILFKPHPDPNSLKEILTKSMGILTIVDKKREIYFIDNIKFHLDTVKDLGFFVEIEAIDLDKIIGKERLLEQCQFYLNLFEIPQSNLVSCSYSDLLLQKYGNVAKP